MIQIPIIIPAYEPDQSLLTLLEQLIEYDIGPVIVVDDGSEENYRDIFKIAEQIISEQNGIVITHKENMGKGKALKTAFSYVIDKFPEAIGVVTADSDGQHSVACIQSAIAAFVKKPDNLILGVRKFDGEGIPWKSRFGNTVTEKVFAYVSGVHVSDTQTGLRGIPYEFMKKLLDVKYDRFEFEMQMLLECANAYSVTEVPIKTIYDSKKKHQTHFRPIKDSIKIYRLLIIQFVKYIFASLSSSVIDLLLFSLFCYFFKEKNVSFYIALATILARVCSAIYNYIINYKLVFNSKKTVGISGGKYALLVLIQMASSAIFVTLLSNVFCMINEVIIKVIVDTILFFVSYFIQRRFIF